jgi:hypothetical protein
MKHSREFVEILDTLLRKPVKGLPEHIVTLDIFDARVQIALMYVSDDAPITRVLIDTESEKAIDPMHVRRTDITGKHSLRSLSGTRTILRRQAGF